MKKLRLCQWNMTIKKIIYVAILVLLLNFVNAHVESGISVSETEIGIKISYYTEPTRIKAGDNVYFNLIVYNDSEFGSYVEIYSIPSTISISEPHQLMEGKKLTTIYLNEVEKNHFKTSYKFRNPGVYILRFVLTDSSFSKELLKRDKIVHVEPITPSKIFLAYFISFLLIAPIFSKLNEMKMEKLKKE